MMIQPGDRGVDFAYRAPYRTGQAIRLAGFSFAIRYICTYRTNSKHITFAERDELLAAGLGLLFVWETSTLRPFSGAAAGTEDGDIARSRLLAFGYPVDVPVLLAFDTDVTSKTLAAAEAYGRAFIRAVGWPVIPYGDTDIGDALSDVTQGTWLPNAGAWSRLKDWIFGGNEHVVMKQGKQDTANGWDPNVCRRPVHAWDLAGSLTAGIVPIQPVTIQEPPRPVVLTIQPGRWPAIYNSGDDDMGYIAGNDDDRGPSRWYVTGTVKHKIKDDIDVERLKRRKLLRVDFNLADLLDPDLEWMTTDDLNSYATV